MQLSGEQSELLSEDQEQLPEQQEQDQSDNNYGNLFINTTQNGN